MRKWLHSLFSGSSENESTEEQIARINHRRNQLASANDDDLGAAFRQSVDLLDTIAITAVVAARVLGLSMFDVQLQGSLAMANGKIAEMQTGEGKTLAAVPAVVWYARQNLAVHIMTANDYLARRDAEWMGGIYRFLGLSVGCIQQNSSTEDRKHAYACDVTYSTANEIGFDFLRDQLALYTQDQVHRPFGVALVDEADSILIDEARIPLVIAGGELDEEPLAHRVERVTRAFRRGLHFTVDDYERNIALTDTGIAAVEHAFRSGNLFREKNLALLTAVQDSLHAHTLLRRDVDYIVKNGEIESIDEFKGRVADNRRWPAGLQAAIEAKEGLELKQQGRILGSITLQNLIAMYSRVCGMTGTAATQTKEFKEIYKLDVEVIPTNRPVIRVDHPDELFRTKHEKEDALEEEVRTVHRTGQPVLVGTSSVEESERLSRRLRRANVPHQVLNARNDEQEAAIIARAGERGAVTISTNMAGRGTDIRLGEGVVNLGGLHVIGTNRHESRRIDNQLRGRAGRQGDPGSSRFFISLQDPLLVKYGIETPLFRDDPEAVQRVVEGQNLEIRKFLHQYESVVETHRQLIQARRQSLLDGTTPCSSENERLVSLTAIDDLWSDYLASIKELREGIHWISLGGGNPFYEYLNSVDDLFKELEAQIDEEIEERLAQVEAGELKPLERGATWTYLTSDQPFGTLSERFARGLMKRFGRAQS
jgi:preprotein translocase subunit SecA